MNGIRQIMVFLIITDLLALFINGETYKKYLKIISGMLLVLMILRPVSKWLAEEKFGSLVENRMMEFEVIEADQSLINVSQEAALRTKQLYEEKTAGQIRQYLSQQKIAVKEVAVEMEVKDRQVLLKQVVITPEESGLTAGDGDIINDEMAYYAMIHPSDISEVKEMYICHLLKEHYGIDQACIHFV